MSSQHVPGCTGKVCYPTRPIAVRAASGAAPFAYRYDRSTPANTLRGRGRKQTHIYRCGNCEGWHLTKSALPRAELERRQRVFLEAGAAGA